MAGKAAVVAEVWEEWTIPVEQLIWECMGLTVALSLFTMLFMFGATLTIIGSFFRGTGYNWVWPWAQGVFFEL